MWTFETSMDGVEWQRSAQTWASMPVAAENAAAWLKVSAINKSFPAVRLVRLAPV